MGSSILTSAIRAVSLATGLLCAATAANAATVFSDNFDAAASSGFVLNWEGGPNWDVESGSIDLIQNNSFGIVCHNSSTGCVDLDGTTQNAGILLSSALFNVVAGQTYTLNAWLSGSQRTFTPPSNPLNKPNEIEFGFKDGSDVTLSTKHVGPLAISAPFTLYTLTFTPGVTTQASIFFSSLSGSDDNVGAILDDVSLSTVPLPAALPLLLSALGGLGAIGRRRARQSRQIAA